MKHVVLDTSVLISDFWLRGAYTQKLLQGADKLSFTLVIPQVVVDETFENFKKSLSKVFKETEKTQQNARQLGANISIDCDYDELIKSYRAFLEKLQKRPNVFLQEYPEISFQEMVDASYNLGLPFRDKGTGWKDFLVWQSILELRQKHNTHVEFVTHNIRDFSEDGELPAEHLAKQIEKEERTIKLRKNVRELCDAIVTPWMRRLESIQESIYRDDQNTIIARDEIQAILEEQLIGYQLHELDEPTKFSEPSVANVDEFQVEEVSAAQFTEEQIFIDVYGTVDLSIDVFIEKTQLMLMSTKERSRFSITSADWNEYVSLASTDAAFVFRLGLIYDEANSVLENPDVEILEQLH